MFYQLLSKLETEEKKIRDFEGIATETIKNEYTEEKIPKNVGEMQGQRKSIWNHNAWNSFQLMKTKNPQVQEVQWVLSRRTIRKKPQKDTLYANFLKKPDKEPTLKQPEIKDTFCTEKLRKEWQHIFHQEPWQPLDNGMTYLKCWGKKSVNPEFYIQKKYLLKFRQNKDFRINKT